MAGAPVRINVALQGGGAHGAFSWGLLEALLEEPGLEIASLTATSAGAMNAVVCAEGLRLGGREGARQALAGFWEAISSARGPFSPVSMNQLRKAFDPLGLLKEQSFKWFDMLTSVASPYEFNPWNFNPLRDVLDGAVDFAALAKAPPVKLFLAATRVSSGTVRVFREHEVSLDAVLATACLPYLFQAVEVEGEAFWDGGYVANPALFPIAYEPDLPDDILISWINPLRREATPRTSADIMDRLNEITFNTSLLAELRAIVFVQKLLRDEAVATQLAGRYRNLHIHAVEADEALSGLPVSSKFDTSPEFLERLRQQGRAAFASWHAAHRQDLGVRCSVDIEARLLGRTDR
jgi:NTE family protein